MSDTQQLIAAIIGFVITLVFFSGIVYMARPDYIYVFEDRAVGRFVVRNKITNLYAFEGRTFKTYEDALAHMAKNIPFEAIPLYFYAIDQVANRDEMKVVYENDFD